MDNDTVRIAAKILVLQDAIVAREALIRSIQKDEISAIHKLSSGYMISFIRGIEFFHKAAEMLFFDVSELRKNSFDLCPTLKCDYFTYRRIEGQVVTCMQLCTQK